MALKRSFAVQTGQAPAIPGYATDFAPFTVRYRSSYEQPLGGPQTEPFAIFNSVTGSEEGVDYPFYSRLAIGQPIRRKRAHQPPPEFPVPILEIGQDTDLLIFARLVTTPENWRGRTRVKRSVALEANPPKQFFRMPFTTYSDDLCRMLDEIRRHLLEKDDTGSHTWSLWTETEVLESVDHRIARFLVETGLVRERRSITAVSATASYDLPTDMIELRRVVWSSGGTKSNLPPIDSFQLDNAVPGWQTETGTPIAYVEEPLSPLSLRLYPTPNTGGTIEIIIVPLPPAVTRCVNLPLPATFIPYLKWGVLADLFRKEGEANDPERAAYCEDRFTEGIALARALMNTKEDEDAVR